MNVCTIIAKNYVAHARVLARSLAEIHPDSRLQTLIIDDFAGYVDPAAEPFDVLTPEAIGCEPFTSMAMRYSVLELSTAVKPWLMRHLLALTGEPVTYLDPDIRLLGSLAQLVGRAERHPVVLTPHNLRPIPADGRRPSQVDVMIAGIYNLGYVTLAPGEETDALIDWWADRLRRDCRVDPIWGYFVDQRWFDLVPGFVSDLAIVHDPEFNVAYWNLHERHLEHGPGGYTVDGRPLAFFHFSGFDPEQPLVLSRHQDRIDVAAHPVLRGLLAEYAAAVLAEGHATSRHWPYGFAALGDGTRIDERLRALFDRYAEAHNDAVPSPFTLDGVRRFDEWLSEPQPAAPPGITRALALIYELRADLRGAFPNVAGADLEPFLKWVGNAGVEQEPVLARLRDRMLAAASGGRPAAPLVVGPAGAELRGGSWGVNVVGELAAETDAGEAARSLVAGFDAAEVRALPVLSGVGAGASREREYPAKPLDEAAFAVNVVCLGPERLPELATAAPGLFAGRYTVGLWSWPGEAFPAAWRERLALVDELWAPSTYAAAALREAAGGEAGLAVHAIRMPVAPAPAPTRTRAELGVPDGVFLFLTRVDLGFAAEAQNPLAAIDAFTRAFAPGEGARLLLDCRGAAAAPPETRERLARAAAAHPDVELLDRDRGPAEASAVLPLADAYVSLHRATGFGFSLAEAMWLGKPTIATGYSGNLEFMTAENSLLAEHALVSVGPGHEPIAADSRWAEPDAEHAARLMRRLFEDRRAAVELGAAGARSIRHTHSPQAAAGALAERLQAIRVAGRTRRRADTVIEQPRALARLPLRLAAGPHPVTGGRAPAARERLRRAVLRAMRPFTAYQAGINAELVTALAELSRDVEAARRDATASWTDLLAMARRAGGDPAIHQLAAGVEELKRILTLETDRELYLALGELARRHEQIGVTPGEPSPTLDLAPFELRVFSQNGEDGVLAEILRRIGAPARWFVEFGVESGREGNCVYLADAAGWDGLFLEAGEEMFAALRRKYAARPRIRTVQARVAAANVERLFAQGDVPPEPDVVSIDIDGQDLWVWRALGNFRPRVVVIEYNSALDPRRRLVQPDQPDHAWDGTDFYGASLGALRALGEEKGYRLVHTDHSAVNAFFVRGDLAGGRFAPVEEVAGWGQPNFYGRGIRHPRAYPPGRYLDLDAGTLVPGREA